VSGGPYQAKAPAKVNLGLFVGPPRADGRHELVTVMQPITVADRLYARTRPQAGEDLVAVVGATVEGEELTAKAIAALRRALPEPQPALEVVVEKEIPLAGGLAGGSADAGAALRLAGRLWGVGAAGPLLAVAAQLGADVPAQVEPRRYLATGAGERLEPLPPPAGECALLLCAAPFGLSTAAVYREADRLGLPRPAEELEGLRCRLRQALGSGEPLPPAELLVNDLEPAAFSLCPELAELKQLLVEVGPQRALLSGSGPTLLALFAGAGAAWRAARAAQRLGRSGRFARLWVAGFAPPDLAEPRPCSQPPWQNGGQRDEQA
jgi:4-diphosphocytidyl-2-C-methyl-D-erythritol kinase